jgi:hypothetical protein
MELPNRFSLLACVYHQLEELGSPIPDVVAVESAVFYGQYLLVCAIVFVVALPRNEFDCFTNDLSLDESIELA